MTTIRYDFMFLIVHIILKITNQHRLEYNNRKHIPQIVDKALQRETNHPLIRKKLIHLDNSNLLYFFDDSMLDLDVLKNGFNNHIHIAEISICKNWFKIRQCLISFKPKMHSQRSGNIQHLKMETDCIYH